MKRLLAVPVWFYSLGLGFLLGERFLYLVHRGRKSGRVRRTVLEIVAHTDGEYVVCSGTGPRADWYLNLRAGPPLAVGVGARLWTASHRFLSSAEAAEVFAEYERRNPRLAANLLDLMGHQYDGTDAGRLALMEDMPMVAFSQGFGLPPDLPPGAQARPPK